LGSTRRHLCPQVYRQGQHACAHASYWAPTTLFHTWAYMTASNLPPWAPLLVVVLCGVKHGSPI
ncbi:hypothetical protein PSTT_15713, partial [Puccinia striiformis]